MPSVATLPVVEGDDHPLEIVAVVFFEHEARRAGVDLDGFFPLHVPEDEVDHVGEGIDGGRGVGRALRHGLAHGARHVDLAERHHDVAELSGEGRLFREQKAPSVALGVAHENLRARFFGFREDIVRLVQIEDEGFFDEHGLAQFGRQGRRAVVKLLIR